MAHFSASGDSIASLFIVVRIGFEPCNNYYLAALLQDAVLLITVICPLIRS